MLFMWIVHSLAVLSPLAPAHTAQDADARADRRAQLAQIAQRLDAGDLGAIDEILASTPPASPGRTPTSQDIERLRIEVDRLRAARPAPITASPAHEAALHPIVPATARNAAMAVREGRAWLRAGDPNHGLKALPPAASGDASALIQRAFALERLGRDAEALELYRRVAADASAPLLQLTAASGVDPVAWRMRRSGASPITEQVKP